MNWLIALTLRGLIMSIMWVGLAGTSVSFFPYGMISVLAATALSLGLIPAGKVQPTRWGPRVWGSLQLVGWFVWQSVRGGLDVSRRALTRRIRIDPEMVTAGVKLPEGPALELSLILMNLLPGSMIQRVQETQQHTTVEIHTLALELQPAQQWETLQDRVAKAFHLPTPEPDASCSVSRPPE